MKNWVFVLLMSVCIQTQAQIEFTGEISGVADEDALVELPADWFGQRWTGVLPVVNSKFQKKFTVPASGWLKITYKDKDKRFFIWKEAKQLNVSFEADFLDGEVNASGDAAAISNFQSAIDEKFGSQFSLKWLEEQAKDATNIDAMEMDAFTVRNDVIYALENSDEELPEAFIKAYKNYASYYYYLSLFKFSEEKTASSNIPKATEIPKVLIEGLTWERMNKASELDSKFFRELLLSYVEYQALAQYDFMKFADRHTAIQEAFNVARENLRGQSLQFFLTKTMLAESEMVQPSLLRQMRNFLAESDSSDLYVRLVEDSLTERLAAKDEEVETVLKNTDNKSQVDVEVIDLNGKTFKLSDLKGKVVYLDIWASWCGPCRKQFPAAAAMKEQLSKKEKKQIEFLYISIDNTETVWKKAINELKIDGTHGLSQGGWGSEVTAKFGVNSIPRYLIFDKKGNVVDANAPRPSDPRTIQILRKLAAD